MKQILSFLFILSALCYGCGGSTNGSAQDADSLSLDTVVAMRDTSTAVVLPDGEYHLLVMDSLVTGLHHLKEKTIGINSRRHGGFVLLDSIIAEARLEEGDCFGIPIDDIDLRQQMLRQRYLDAALLPDYLADSAQVFGAHTIRVYKIAASTR